MQPSPPYVREKDIQIFVTCAREPGNCIAMPAATLSPFDAERTSAFLEPEFARLKAQELTTSFRPENGPADWERRRDAAMTKLASRMRPLLPANHAQLPLLPNPFYLSLLIPLPTYGLRGILAPL